MEKVNSTLHCESSLLALKIYLLKTTSNTFDKHYNQNQTYYLVICAKYPGSLSFSKQNNANRIL